MWMLTSAIAIAAEMPAPEPASAPTVESDVAEPTLSVLPIRGAKDEQKWDLSDRRSVALSRYALGVGLVSTALGSASGIVVGVGIDYDEEALIALGALGVTLGSVGALASAPILFGSVQYSNRTLRERGVYVSSTAGVVGWSLLGSGTILVPIFAALAAVEPAAAITIPMWYGGVLACGVVQMQLNERGRTNAGLERGGNLFRQVAVLPSPRGFRLVGTF
ncbi:MAG: hypothetical protein KC621_11185 [Myxococcales bacterium]|nr:hypothetical protein [Myxococcales bacterium]